MNSRILTVSIKNRYITFNVNLINDIWSRVILEKLTVTQLVKKFPALWKPKAHYRVHNSPPLVPILSQMHPLHTYPPCFLISEI
jgi:hypothetical protein